MTPSIDLLGTRLIACFSVALVLLGLTTSNGFYSIDDVIYFQGVENLANLGRFGAENGYATFASEHLRLRFLVNGPQGLAPQYPVGSALAAAPLTGIFGLKSLIFLNVLAGVGTLFTTHRLSLRLFGSMQTANLTVGIHALCTFWGEYVAGHWPHSISVFLLSSALLLFLKALDRTQRAVVPALGSGILVGLAMFFRLEGLLLLPAVAAATIIYAARPVQILCAGAIGLAPVMALMALANKLRFGSYNPLSYGSSGGGTDLSTYMIPGLAILGGLIGLCAIRAIGNPTARSQIAWAIVAALGLGAMLLSPLAPYLIRLVNGFHALFLDATIIEDPRLGATKLRPDGTVSFWGLPKKALGQSLPWLGCLTLLVALRWGEHKRSITLILIVLIIWSLPFLWLSWHGGLSSNMRYFLPVIPLIAALAAWLIFQLAQRGPTAKPSLLAIAGLAGFFAPILWGVSVPDQTFRLNQDTSTTLLYIVAALSLATGFWAKPALSQLSLYSIVISLGFSSFLAIQDYSHTQMRRSVFAADAKAISTISDRVLFYGAPVRFHSALQNPQQMLALPDQNTAELDLDLIDAACAAGYRVLLARHMAEPLMSLGAPLTDYVWPTDLVGPPIVELGCAG